MRNVLSLIAANSKAALTPAVVDEARWAMEATHAAPGEVDWLSPDEAADIPFEAPEAGALNAVRAALRHLPVDINVLPDETRRKRLLVADMDSTLIEQECIDELADEMGIGPQVAAITERAMRGEIAFEPALRERVGLLKGLRADIAEKVLAERVTLMPGARTLVSTMRAHGAHTALVSGGFTLFTGPIGRMIGFDEDRGNALLLEKGTFNGLIAEPILGQAAKQEALLELTARLGLETAETLAAGDGANDIGMIRRAGLGVAYRAKPALREAAGAIIDHGDLTALLFLQGYRREEFVIDPPPPAGA